MKDLDERELAEAMKHVRGTWRPWLLLVLTIGIAGYGGYHLQQRTAAAERAISDVDVRISDKEAQIAVLEGAKKELEQRIARVDAENQALMALKKREEAAAKELAAAKVRLGRIRDQIGEKTKALGGNLIRMEIADALEIEIADKVLFDGVEPVGSKTGTDLLLAIGGVLTSTNGVELEIGVHSDAGPTAWETSAARAAAIARVFAEQSHFEATKVRAIGYGHSRPIARTKTRRVQLVIGAVKPDGR